jgi:hypothetical protein
MAKINRGNKPTPGKWKTGFMVIKQFGISSYVVGIEGSETPVALIAPESDLDDQDRANAALIAAAPELLAALQDMLAVWPYMENKQTNAARLAVASARGY